MKSKIIFYSNILQKVYFHQNLILILNFFKRHAMKHKIKLYIIFIIHDYSVFMYNVFILIFINPVNKFAYKLIKHFCRRNFSPQENMQLS